MCITLPAKIKKIDSTGLMVAAGGKDRRVKNAIFGRVKKGDWVAVTADLAVARITAKEAKEILKIVKRI